MALNRRFNSTNVPAEFAAAGSVDLWSTGPQGVERDLVSLTTTVSSEVALAGVAEPGQMRRT